MSDVVISDASVLIALDNINELSILKDVFERLYTTETVASEYGKPLPQWIEIRDFDEEKAQSIQKTHRLDAGEASTIALALEVPGCLLLIDEWKGRNEAKLLGLNILGALGVLIRAKKTGVISEIAPYMARLQTVGFRMSPNLIRETLKLAGEMECK